MIEVAIKPRSQRAGPSLDTHHDTSHIHTPYSEGRDIHAHEREMRDEGFNFSFVEALHDLRAKFPNAETLLVLSGGSGTGGDLGDIKSLGDAFNIPVRTTAVTLAKRNLTQLQEERVDTAIIDSVQDAYLDGKLQGPYHFIIDVAGAIHNDDAFARDGTVSKGESVIPIYGKLLASGGRLLFATSYLTDQYDSGRQNIFHLLSKNHLKIVQMAGNYALVEKEETHGVSTEEVAVAVHEAVKRNSPAYFWEMSLKRLRERNEAGLVMGYGFSELIPRRGEREMMESFTSYLKEPQEDEREEMARKGREVFFQDCGFDTNLVDNPNNARWKKVEGGDRVSYYLQSERDTSLYIVRTVIPNRQHPEILAVVSEHFYFAPSEARLLNALSSS